VIWVNAEDENYFQTGDITEVLRLAERVGIAAWTLDSRDPTSTFTHPGVVIRADDLVRSRRYSDHVVTMCVCGWVCMLA